MDLRFQAADTVIFLVINRWVCIYNAVKRWITNIGKTRPDMAKDCPEKIDFEFIKWIYTFLKTSRNKIISMIEAYKFKYKDKNIIILKSRKEIHRFLKELELIK